MPMAVTPIGFSSNKMALSLRQAFSHQAMGQVCGTGTPLRKAFKACLQGFRGAGGGRSGGI